MQGDVEVATFLTGRDDDAVDHLAERLGCFTGVIRMAERVGQALDPTPVDVADVGMDVRDVHRNLRQARVEVVLLGLKLGETVEQRAVETALLDDADDLLDGLLGVGQLAAGCLT